MGRIASPDGRVSGRPVPPAAIADEVELYARQSGRTATMDFVPLRIIRGRVAEGVWRVRFSLRPNDPRMKLFQEGKAEKPPTEDVWLHTPNPRRGQKIEGAFGQRELDYLPLDIEKLGPSGVREFLERGNTWSERGEYASIEEQAKAVQEHNDSIPAKNKAEQKEINRYQRREERRHRLKIPFLPIEIDLGKRATDTAEIGGETTA